MKGPIGYVCQDWISSREVNLQKILITGGAGFIGSNAADFFSKQGMAVTVLDNLSRETGVLNVAWLKEHSPSIDIREVDVRDSGRLSKVVEELKPDFILHLAAQVAVTDSLIDPRSDFEVNALGTLNLLEAIRLLSPESKLIYASTNKVYGQLESLELSQSDTRYLAKGSRGISEAAGLDFYSPYGCSKGAADQYVLDYARIFGLKTASLRQSCIYGPRQFGVEDQGWMAWFAIATLAEKQITIYGNGKQVRDALFVDDLLDLYSLLFQQEVWVGGSYNVGGGMNNATSLLDYLADLEALSGLKPAVAFSEPRPGDQLWFVSDNTRAETVLGWKPKVPLAEGIKKMLDWLNEAKKRNEL